MYAKKFFLIMNNIEQEIYTTLGSILKNRFPNDSVKQKYHVHSDRINFACPICGDSHEDSNKKRGNLWFKTNSYKCYNCDYFSSTKNFFIKMESENYVNDLSDGIYKLDIQEGVFTPTSNIDRIDTNISYIMSDVTSDIERYGIHLTEFVKFLRLTPIEYSPLFRYIKGRSIPTKKYNLFFYSKTFKNIIIVNLDVNTQRVIGYTIRNFKGSSKYINFKLNTMYRHFKREYDENDESFKSLDAMSSYYNITNINLNKPLTYFEGPIDSMFVLNSIALNTVGAKLPIVTNNTRIILDNDEPGRKKALEYLGEKKTIFMWKKFLKDIGMVTYDVDKVDFNDVILYLKGAGKKLPDLNDYFTNSKLDSLWV